jgi:hypothetical protein
VFGIPAKNIAFCILHAKMRVVEKLLKLLGNFALTQSFKVDEIYVKRWQETINKLNGLGSFKYFKPKDATSSVKWNITGLSGTQAATVLENHAKISEKWFRIMREWSDALEMIKNDSERAELVPKMKCSDLPTHLFQLFQLLETWNPTQTEISQCQKMGSLVLKEWIEVFGEAHVTPYLHMITMHGYQQLEKFAPFGGLVAVSQQGK